MTFKIKKQNINLTAGFCSRSRLEPGWLAGPEPSLWPGSGSSSALKICLIIQENYMELNIIWCLFWSKHKIWPTCTGTCVRTYFRQFVASFKKFQHFVLFYQEPEPAPDKKFPEPEPPKTGRLQNPEFKYYKRILTSLILSVLYSPNKPVPVHFLGFLPSGSETLLNALQMWIQHFIITHCKCGPG